MSIFSLYLHIPIQGKILIGFLGSGTQRLGQSLCPGVGLSTVIDRLIGILWNVSRKDREVGAGCYPQKEDERDVGPEAGSPGVFVFLSIPPSPHRRCL